MEINPPETSFDVEIKPPSALNIKDLTTYVKDFYNLQHETTIQLIFETLSIALTLIVDALESQLIMKAEHSYFNYSKNPFTRP